MDYQTIIDYYYPNDNALRRLLLKHSSDVARKALAICDRHPELHLDRDFVEAAAMLHDIGICQCDAPGISCFGTRPYIQHGLAGAQMIETEDAAFKALPVFNGADVLIKEKLARVCQRHTGAGITRAEVVAQQLPLPLPDDDSEPYMPETPEEQVVCFADKFFSKTKLLQEKTYEQAERSLMKFGTDGLERFRQWAAIFM